MTLAEIVTQGPIGVGSKFHCVTTGARAADMTIELTEFDRPRRLESTTHLSNMDINAEIAARVRPAGVKVIESRISRLAYAPEIAQAMLRRQQASAVVAARKRIVEGAVGMVQMALERLEDQDIVTLDDERKATMVSNLLVVLCSDQATQPVVNVGSLYQ
jgi:hypothetical protein